MSTHSLERISSNRDVMLGKPVIRGTRITVQQILEKLAADVSIDDILVDHSQLTRGDVLAALAYAAHVVETEWSTRRARS